MGDQRLVLRHTSGRPNALPLHFPPVFIPVTWDKNIHVIINKRSPTQATHSFSCDDVAGGASSTTSGHQRPPHHTSSARQWKKQHVAVCSGAGFAGSTVGKATLPKVQNSCKVGKGWAWCRFDVGYLSCFEECIAASGGAMGRGMAESSAW